MFMVTILLCIYGLRHSRNSSISVVAPSHLLAKQVDILVYMALGNTLGSHLLALGRLAPVQVEQCH